MSRYTDYRNKITGGISGFGSSLSRIGKSIISNPMSLVDPVDIGVGAVAKELLPKPPATDESPITTPDVPGPQDVPLREQSAGQLLAAQRVQATGGEDLPGTSLFSPKRKAASRALVGY